MGKEKFPIFEEQGAIMARQLVESINANLSEDDPPLSEAVALVMAMTVIHALAIATEKDTEVSEENAFSSLLETILFFTTKFVGANEASGQLSREDFLEVLRLTNTTQESNELVH